MAKLELTEGPGIKLKKDTINNELSILGTADVIIPPSNYSDFEDIFSLGRTPIIDGRMSIEERGTRYIYPINRGNGDIHYASPVYKNKADNEYNIILYEYLQNESGYTKEVKSLGVISPITGKIDVTNATESVAPTVTLDDPYDYAFLKRNFFDENTFIKAVTPLTIYFVVNGIAARRLMPFTLVDYVDPAAGPGDTSDMKFYNPIGVKTLNNSAVYKIIEIVGDGKIIMYKE